MGKELVEGNDSIKINKLKKKGSPRHTWQSHTVISAKSKDAQRTRSRDTITHVTSTTTSPQPLRGTKKKGSYNRNN